VKVLVLGSGAREHALAWKLASGSRAVDVLVGPGNAGTPLVGANLPGVDPMNAASVISACRGGGVDCVFVGPEAPLAAGIVDALAAEGIPAVGPGKRAAQLESSKAFSKSFLVRNSIPTAEAVEFSDPAPFESYLRSRAGQRLVVKKSGLAAGKGVLESSDASEMSAFGSSILGGDRLLVEEFLEGWEVSIFGLSDGKSHVVLPPCTDFKKAYDGDTGPNTGGMGSICPVPWVDAALMESIRTRVVEPTYAALAREGLAYAGVLYFGLMITRQGPKVLEFNVRFGDPETQVLLPVLDLDFGALVEAMTTGTLADFAAGMTGPSGAAPRAAPGAALGVVVASRGYPDSSEKGVAIEPVPDLPPDRVLVFHASTSLGTGGRARTGGGRCFTVVGLGADLRAASRNAYAAAGAVRFDGAWFRGDIGRKFIEAKGASGAEGGRP
jgi:phosphoribosylamine---glycine ligase